jgi:hypothetical protein
MERGIMKRLAIALTLGAILTIFPIAILKLPTDSGMTGTLKWGVTSLMTPGVFVGLVVSGGRVDDVNRWIAAL